MYGNYGNQQSSAPGVYVPSAAANADPVIVIGTTATSTSSSVATPSYSSTATPTRTQGDSLPDFSQALNYPAPPASTYQSTATATAVVTGQPVQAMRQDYGKTSSYDNYNSYASAPVSYATSKITSATYTSGPSHGLVSEGNPVKCHRIDYEIKGNDMQLVEIELDPGETVIAEAGAMMFLEDMIDFQTKFGDGSTPKQGFFSKILAAGGRILTGESLFITHFTNKGHGKARVAFAAPYPGTIIPVNMADVGQKLICQKDAFLCAAKGTKLSLYFNRKIGSGLFGGEGFILQKLEGDGMAFIHAGGTIIRRELRGERIRLDTGCLVAFTEGIKFDITLVKGLKSLFFGGEGLFLATLEGHGTVWMQSLPFSRMADRIIQSAPSIGGRRQGEGSALTGRLGDVLDGDGFGFNF